MVDFAAAGVRIRRQRQTSGVPAARLGLTFD